MNTELLQAYAKTRADRLDQVRSKIAILNNIIADIEDEATRVYTEVLGNTMIDPDADEGAFVKVDKEYAEMAADLRSARETNRVLLAHLTAALVRAPFLNLFANGDTPNES